ncbi:MAG: hypothetical protein KAH84_06720 [Thiomargarita sp.]|nr:hypothetical protein [Thiomargarita sp.]
MIDLHCHLLPAIDDGANNLEDALAMARMAYENGIETAIMTPHIMVGRYDNDVNTIRTAFTAFKQALQEHDIPLKIGMSAEVRIGTEIIWMVGQNLIPFLGTYDGYRILLLEMPYNNIPPGSDKMVNWLLKQKIRPLIAHPERNGDVVRRLDKINPFIEQGCLLQITSRSLTGQFGEKTQERAQQLLEKGWVNVIATDAHDQNYRPPDLECGRIAVAEIVGEAEAWELVHDAPARLINGLV